MQQHFPLCMLCSILVDSAHNINLALCYIFLQCTFLLNFQSYLDQRAIYFIALIKFWIDFGLLFFIYLFTTDFSDTLT